MPRALSLEQLAEESDSEPELLRRLVGIGVLRPGSHGRFIAGDIIRVEAARSFLDAGLSFDDIAAALDSGLFTFEFLDRFHPEPAPRSGHTLAHLAALLGVEGDVMTSVYLAMGLPDPTPDHLLRTDEEAILADFVATWGVEPETLLRAARLIGEPARVVSEGWARLFVEKISEPLTASADRPMDDRIAVIALTTEKATRLAPEMLHWLLQRHMRQAIDQVNIEGFEQTMAEHGLSLPSPTRLPAIAFVDVSGYTSMTEREGDDLAVRTSEMVRLEALASARANRGSLVKILGDGVMLHFDDVTDALTAVLGLIGTLGTQGLPAHAGIHAGALIERDGDYFGRTVNLASRVAGQAGPGQVLVTSEVAGATEQSGFSFEQAATVALKGIAGEVDLFRVSIDAQGEG